MQKKNYGDIESLSIINRYVAGGYWLLSFTDVSPPHR